MQPTNCIHIASNFILQTTPYHLCLVCFISIFCIFGGNGRPYRSNPRPLNYGYIQLFQFTLSDQSFNRIRTRHPQSSCSLIHLNPNISFIQMVRHRRSSLYGRGIVNFPDSYSLRSYIPLRSSLVGLRL